MKLKKILFYGKQLKKLKLCDCVFSHLGTKSNNNYLSGKPASKIIKQYKSFSEKYVKGNDVFWPCFLNFYYKWNNNCLSYRPTRNFILIHQRRTLYYIYDKKKNVDNWLLISPLPRLKFMKLNYFYLWKIMCLKR